MVSTAGAAAMLSDKRASIRPSIRTINENAVDTVNLVMTESVRQISEQVDGDPASVEADEVRTRQPSARTADAPVAH